MTTATLSPDDPFDAGPYTGVLNRLHLGGTKTRTTYADNRVRLRAVICFAIAWVPLVVLGAFQGVAIGPTPHQSVLLDPAAYGRYVVALPLLVLAEAMCFPRLALLVHELEHSGLIPESKRSRYEALIASTRRLLGQRGVGMLIAVTAYAVAIASTDVTYPKPLSTWVAPIGEAGRALSYAGWWRLMVSQPLFLTVVVAWLWRILLWARLLFHASRLDLQLVPAHPDRAGGLRFLALSLRGFRLFAAGLAAAVAGSVSAAYFIDHQPLKSFQPVIIAVVVLILLFTAGPLLVFVPVLQRARATGTIVYGRFIEMMGQQFQRRWLGERSKVDEDTLTRQDFSAMTDMSSVGANVYSMKVVPFDVRALLPVIVFTLIPFLPVLLAVVPLRDLIKYAAKMVL